MPKSTEAPADAPADDLKTEQEKGGPDPVSPPVEPTRAEPLDIPAGEPYPTGGANPVPGVPHNTPPADEG